MYSGTGGSMVRTADGFLPRLSHCFGGAPNSKESAMRPIASGKT